jgi:CubicO group peptidase (beta-lactamase class C family)
MDIERRDFLRLASLAAAAVPARAYGLAARQPDTRFDEIAALVETKMTEYGVPAVGLGILNGDDLAMRGFGVASLDDPRPVTPETLFTIASISKTVTATAIMKLVEEGRLALRAPVRTYLPAFRVRDDAASRDLQIWHLLTHTPGFEGQLSTRDLGAESLADFADNTLPTLPQLAPPGAVWGYNNAGFTLAGRVIEVVTGRNIHTALRELVFAPLGLTRAFTRLVDAMTYPVTLGHRERGGRTEVMRPFQTTSSATAGGVIISLADLMAWARFHLGDGTAPDGRPYLSRASLDLMQAPQAPKNSTGDAIGLAWHLRPLGGVLTAAHGGTLNSHCLHLQLVPSRLLAFAILTTHSNGWRLVQDVEHTILRRYANLALAPNQAIGHRGVNEAMTFHSTPLPAQPDLAEYAGEYVRPPLNGVTVRQDGDHLVVGSGNAQRGTSIVFYGPDVAYATAGSYEGSPYEFIRAPDDRVGWIRMNGRIARKEN